MQSQEVDGLGDALREFGAEVREAAASFSEALDVDRRMEEAPLAVLGVAAAAGLVLGGGFWPLLRPFVKAAARSALSPANLVAVGVALGAIRAAGGREPGAAQGPMAH